MIYNCLTAKFKWKRVKVFKSNAPIFWGIFYVHNYSIMKQTNHMFGGWKMDNKNFTEIYNEYKQQAENQARAEDNQEITSSQEAIVAVRKNDDGDIIAFKTETGREIDYLTALHEAKSGMLAHVDVFHKYGRDIIRSEADGIKENNLDQLPEF